MADHTIPQRTIIPTLIEEQNSLALEFTIQKNPTLDLTHIYQPSVLKLVINMPIDITNVENVAPVPETFSEQESNSELSTEVIWQNIDLQSTGYKRNEIPTRTFYIRFNNTDNSNKPSGIVMGKVIVQFKGAISSVENVHLFDALGYEYGIQPDITEYTNVTVDFSFNLSSLKIRRNHHESKQIEQTIIPSHEMITRLVYALSDRKIYVQRVIENPPQTNRANAEIINRFWTIIGRRYNKASPIDFRIVAAGQEHYKDADTPYSGHARFEIMTQGTFVNNVERKEIRKLLKDISKIIRRTPTVEMWLDPYNLETQKWGTIFAYIKNTGKALVENIQFSTISNLVELNHQTTTTIKKLKPGRKKRVKLTIKAKAEGEIPLVIIVSCYDQYGRLPIHPYSCKLEIVS